MIAPKSMTRWYVVRFNHAARRWLYEEILHDRYADPVGGFRTEKEADAAARHAIGPMARRVP